MPNESARTRPERAIADLAARQHGVITTAQLCAHGVLRSGITDRVRAGRLHRVHRGVYALGHPNVSNEGRWMAAVLACGAGAALSHRSAAVLWGMLPTGAAAHRRVQAGPIDVTIAGDAGRRVRQGIRLHRSLTLFPDDLTHRDGIPVTKPARTLTDLRGRIPARDFAAALRQAEYLGLPLDHDLGHDHTRSELEARFLAVCRRPVFPSRRSTCASIASSSISSGVASG
jgi:predicted transcriptional regulator of viral defense system